MMKKINIDVQRSSSDVKTSIANPTMAVATSEANPAAKQREE